MRAGRFSNIADLNAKKADVQTPDELIDLIEAKGLEVAGALTTLRKLGLKNKV